MFGLRASLFAISIAAWSVLGTTFAIALELELVSTLPVDSHEGHSHLLMFRNLVAKGSKGELTIKITPWGKEPGKIPAAVKSGEVAMAAGLLEEYAESVPAANIFVLPGMFGKHQLLAAALAPSSKIRTALEAAILKEMNSKVLWWQPTGAALIVSKGGSVKTPAGIAGKKVYALGDDMKDFLKQCGGVPVEDDVADERAAFERQVSDIALSNISQVEAGKLWEVAKTLTVTRHEVDIVTITINEKIWRSLTPENQKIIKDAALQAEKALFDKFEKVERSYLVAFKNHGMNIVEISDDELFEWKNCSEETVEQFSKKSGILGRALLSEYRNIITSVYRRAP
jgi:C4-dicarboxylate-binding protein DctP